MSEDQKSPYFHTQNMQKKTPLQDEALQKALETIKTVPLVRNRDIEKRSKENSEREIAIATENLLSLRASFRSRKKWIPKIACLLCPCTSPFILVCSVPLVCYWLCRVAKDTLNPPIKPQDQSISKTSIFLRIFDPILALDYCCSGYSRFTHLDFLSSPEQEELFTSKQILRHQSRIKIAHAIKESLPIPDLRNIIVEYADSNENTETTDSPALLLGEYCYS